MTAKKVWKDASELKAAVIASSRLKFREFAGRDWNPEWKDQLRQEHQRAWASDQEARRLLNALVVAFDEAKAFLQNTNVKLQGPCAQSLYGWCFRLERRGIVQGPVLPRTTPESFRTFIISQFALAVGEVPAVHAIPQELLGVFMLSPARDVVVGIVEGDDYDVEIEYKGKVVKVVEVKEGADESVFVDNTRIPAHFYAMYKMPDNTQMAAISILGGQYPDFKTPYQNMSDSDVLSLERRAVREAREHALGDKNADVFTVPSIRLREYIEEVEVADTWRLPPSEKSET